MSSNNPDIRSLERIISTLLNKQLQLICSSHGLRTSGVKADLQNRIKNALHENYQSDPANYNAIRETILNIRGGNSGPQSMAPPSGLGVQSQGRNPCYSSYGSYQPTGPSMPQPSHGYPNGSASVAGNGTGYPVASRAPHSDTIFKNTPFYTIEKRIGPLHTLPVMNNHRNSITVTLKASDYPDLGRCATYSPTKLMVFCGSENMGLQDIQFPHQSEIKVNDDDVKHNLRGLKNKPGSTHPVDITPFLRLKQANYTNKVEFTYALTTKELVTKIKAKKISKASVIREISKKANDPDVVATSQNLSLKCPLSYARLKVPCRGITCNHIQCFDANSFMQLQEQGPTWSCPICSKAAPFDTLAIDEYVQEVLENTPESCEQVTIEPDGQWRIKSEDPEPTRSRPPNGAKIEDDDDLSILSDTNAFSNGATGGSIGGARTGLGTPSRSLLSGGTPNGSLRETPNTQRSGSSKRPAEVIDLTLSSDEEDEPIRPPKRQNLGPANGLSFPPAYNAY
ncbi:hypothetical protein Daesc_008424 [Daldinia eschscholtzii]|uniref:Uncharacterized protein n=1 Tax=Daldinia eschscholtzii TaxID=292717 RepID=A0AAX6MBM4_9PEZI